jgi:hypothetical protein
MGKLIRLALLAAVVAAVVANMSDIKRYLRMRRM